VFALNFLFTDPAVMLAEKIYTKPIQVPFALSFSQFKEIFYKYYFMKVYISEARK